MPFCIGMKILGKQTIYIIISLFVTAGVFLYLFTIVTPAEIVTAIRQASVVGLVAYMVLSLVTTVLRNWRYLILIRASDTGIPMGGGDMFLVTLVRNLFSDLLPARTGTLIYIYILSARFGFPFEIGASTYAVAFVMDLVVMVPLMCVGVAVVGADRLGISFSVLLAVALAFFAVTVLILLKLPVVLKWLGDFLSRLFWKWRRSAALREKFRITAFETERIMGTPAFWKTVIISFAIRALKYGCLAFLVFAVLNPKDPARYTLRNIGYWPVFVGASLAELTASTPVSGIGGFGAYEGAWTGAFTLLGYPRDLAALSGITAHVITQVFGYSLGALALIILSTPFVIRRYRR